MWPPGNRCHFGRTGGKVSLNKCKPSTQGGSRGGTRHNNNKHSECSDREASSLPQRSVYGNQIEQHGREAIK